MKNISQNKKHVGPRINGLNLLFIGLVSALLFFSGFNSKVIAQGVSINETGVAPDASAALDVSSSSQGLLLPRLTTAERDAIVSPVASLLIFNTTTQCFEAYYEEGDSWISFGCLGCTVPSSVSATPSATSLEVGEDLTLTGAASDAISYDWTGPNGYTSSTQSPIITGVGVDASGVYTLAASNNCGSVTASTVTITVTDPCVAILGGPINHTAGVVAPETKSVNYGVVASDLTGDYKCWITQNLGADNQATSVTDATDAAAGWYWEFNRMQGFTHNGTTTTPAPSNWVIINETSHWIPANDPCTIELGANWRLPTSTEWGYIITNGSWANSADAYNSDLKLHQAGYIDDIGDQLVNRGSRGYYWSSTEDDDTDARNVYFYSSNMLQQTPAKTYGYNVRCMRDLP